MVDYETAVDLNIESDEPLDPKSWKSSKKAWLKLTIIQADELPAMDHTTGKSDPYCVIKLGSKEQFTPVQHKTTNPVWNHTLVFEVDNIPQVCRIQKWHPIHSPGWGINVLSKFKLLCFV